MFSKPLLRYLAPYLAVLMIVTVVTGIAYSDGKISRAALYAILLPGVLIVSLLADRWFERNPRSR